MEGVAETWRDRQVWLSGQRDALEAALDGAPLERSLAVLVRTATEALGQDARAGFYLANDEGTSLHHVIGMSADYAKAVDGFAIGPESLACGLATHSGEPVLTIDVMTDARWEPWRWLAERFDFRGCWSFPIRTSTGKFVGTFAVYSRQPREATQRDRDLASLLTGTAAIIISRHTEAEARRQAEEVLRASQERLRQIVAVDTVGVLFFRLDGRILDANPTLERMTGYVLAELRELDWTVLTPPEFGEATKRAAADLAERGRTSPYEKQWIRKDGSQFWGLFAPTRISGSGSDAECVEFIIDITDRKRAEQALRHSDRRKSEFLATLAHELRNPLAPILNAAHLLSHARSPDPLVTQVRDIIQRQATHMVRLVDDLLDVSRISRGKLELRKHHTELASILHHAIEIAHPLCAGKEQRVEVELPPEPIWLDADAARLTQVFGNLLNNASRYSDRGSSITISVSRDGGEEGDAVVRVRDTGVGIPPDKAESIFEIFEQVDRSLERETGGLGVGLNLVKSLVEMHGGSVRAHSNGPGTGSEFIVRLPALASAMLALRPGTIETAASPEGPRRILVADDNRDAARTIATLLELMGHEVATAHDGVEAVALAATSRADVILLDIGMPRLNGYDAARRIRELHGPNGPKLVAVTGWGQEEDRRRSKEAGFDAHLVKPVNLDELLELLAARCDG